MSQIGITQQAMTKLTGKDDYGTPLKAFLKIQNEYAKTKFEIDACASDYNHKVDYYITKEMNLFNQKLDAPFFMNPIYGKRGFRTFNKGKPDEVTIFNEYGTADFVEFARNQHFRFNVTGAVLLFANVSSSDYFQRFVGEFPEDRQRNECEIFYYPERIQFDKFENGIKVKDGTPSLSSFVVVYDERFGKK